MTISSVLGVAVGLVFAAVIVVAAVVINVPATVGVVTFAAVVFNVAPTAAVADFVVAVGLLVAAVATDAIGVVGECKPRFAKRSRAQT